MKKSIKELIMFAMEKYNKQDVCFVDHLNVNTMGVMASCENYINFDLLDDKLLIEANITKDNIHLYYEFMSDDDIKDFKMLISSILLQRREDIPILLDACSLSVCDNAQEKTIGDYLVESFVFGLKDTLKPIDEYIKEIKQSEVYKQYRADKIYDKLISRALRMFDRDMQTDFSHRVNGYSESGKPYFLAAFRLSKYNQDDKYQSMWDARR